MSAINRMLREERRRQRGALWRACACAALAAASAVMLLGISGWFITAAAFAGAAGPAVANAFNYMLPSAGIRLLAIARTGARYGERLFGHAAALRALAVIRSRLFLAISQSPPRRALSLSSGEATARLVQDVGALETRFFRISAPWSVGAGAVTGGALLLFGGGTAAVVVLAIMATVIVIGRSIARRMQARGRIVQRAAGSLKEAVADAAMSAAELRCYGLQDAVASRIDALSTDLATAQRAQANAEAILEFLPAFATGLAAAAALVLAAPAGADIAAMAALAAAMTLDCATPLLRALAQDGRADEARERLDGWMQAATEAGAQQNKTLSARPSIELRGVVQARLAPGARAAIVGRSGSGKTTLIEQLLCLRDAPTGDILLDGFDIAELPPAQVRALFGWAPQDAAQISGTVRDNLQLADAAAGEDEMWEALADATIDERVRRLEGGLDGWIGENGERLSGGERRRLALARAYLAKTPWLLLDEPTEGLDADTERAAVTRLKARLDRRGQGLIVASHRKLPLELCDTTLHIEAARVPDKRQVSG